MKVSDFDFELPQELIAQKPLEKRDESRLLILDRNKGNLEEKKFYEIIDCLHPGDILVLNETRVKPARLYGHKYKSGGKVEILLLQPQNSQLEWKALAKPGRRLKPGTYLNFGGIEKAARITSTTPEGGRIIEFSSPQTLQKAIDSSGELPLPPYIKEKLDNPEKYQTVFARREGSIAAPTAGLHFTENLLERIKNNGVDLARVTLHIGYDTFKPVEAERIEEHKMHTEEIEVSADTADFLNQARREKRRIIAVGTTVVRTLESSFMEGQITAGRRETDLFIYPGYRFDVIDALITNFHLPRSSLLMLVCAFAGWEEVLRAYQYAVENRFRFFSFGDAMFLK